MEKNKTPSIQDDEFPFGHSRFKLAFLKDPEGARLVIKCVIRSRLLDASHRLEAIVSQLTLDNSSATSPFSGFIININVCTDGHVNKVLVMDRNLEDWVENRNGYTDKSFEAVGLLEGTLAGNTNTEESDEE
ncbi:hypothetical protein C8J56DRAFT_895819 [Mycena floridula]|nr:hypothetical protein C8J56DRAFT_895819 [Mycena floridula]